MLLSLGFMFILISCGSSIEGETTRWENSLSEAEAAKLKYNNISKFIDEDIVLAKKKWEEALTIKEEKAAIDKMAIANRIIKQTYSLVSEYEKNAESLERSINSIEKIGEVNITTLISQVITDAKSKIADSKVKLKNNTFETRNDFKLLLDSYKKYFKDTKNELDEFKSALDKKEKELEKLNTTTNTQESSSSSTEKLDTKSQVSSDIKCKYCKTLNSSTNVKCKNCGAALKD